MVRGGGSRKRAGGTAKLTGAVREGDTVGRLGGNEFVVLVEGASMAAGSEVVAERIRDILATPFSISASDVPLEVTASIGIAESDRAQPGELLRDADIALYRAKASGKDCAMAFSPSMQEAVDNHRTHRRRSPSRSRERRVLPPLPAHCRSLDRNIHRRGGPVAVASPPMGWSSPTTSFLSSNRPA